MHYSYKGKILISTPEASGDIFSRSVVLMIEHNEEGAFGLILNKKNDNMSGSLIKIFDFDVEVYDGGPVSKDKVFFILKGEKITKNYQEISPDFYISEDVQDIITALFENKISLQDFKVFSGYSGWSPGQLEGEIRDKLWTVVDVYNLDYTLPNDHNLWKKIMQNLGGEFLLWANTPEDVSMN
ncbi:MAG: YqgE/AlgH family protein [Cloacibacterium sp.]|nr:YqgE/AlgH family protein [Cloacibacterium sp.]